MKTASVTIPESRASIYGFLAQIFGAHPTQDSISGLREMADVLGIPYPDDLTLTELDQEYMELLVVPNARYVAPYESVFRDQWLVPAVLKRGSNPGETSVKIKGLVMGESTLEVQQCYLKAGVFPGPDLPDHIANEFRFMAHLWASEAENPSAQNGELAELRRRFHEEHILKWIDELRERVVESDRLGYYLAALDVANAVLQDEAEGVHSAH